MKRQTAAGVGAVCTFILLVSFAASARAQNSDATLSGLIAGATGAPVPNAKVAVKNLATGQSSAAQTDSTGHYAVPNLEAGSYEVAVSAEGYSTNTVNVTIASGANQTANVTLAGVLSLQDLGISPEQAQGTTADQARLNKRSHMLMLHQRLGLIAAVPLIATVATSFGAGGRSTSTSDRYLHLALGSATGDLYFMSAYFAIRAPRIPGTQSRGQIRVHKALAWIHGPGMVLTPILGAIAFDQKSKGEKVHGIASAHGAVAIVTAAAYGAAIVSVSFKF
ncbi:MAG TPA: carboxypeptidase-like regulatory domain-containing protein [Candidatus Acidoferrales bacterium]|nr:carboxypeptidase-like regulatory domain-containing protein [Candidatus Acidoferrales bacterium]